MGCSRQPYPSEEQFSRLLNEVRSLDKMLWHDEFSIQDIEEQADAIKARLTDTVEAFRKMHAPASGGRRE